MPDLRLTRRATLAGAALLLAGAAPGATLLDRLPRHRPLICAHRGRLGPDADENSLASFERTVAAGIRMVEFDLSLSRDGTIFILHDPTLDRTTDAHGPLAAMTAAQLERVHLVRDGHVEAAGLTRYDEVVAWAHRTPEALLMLDIKRVAPSLAAAPVRAAGLQSRALMLTFAPDVAEQGFAADPDILVSVLVKSAADLDNYRRMAGSRTFAAYVPRPSDPALFARVHGEGLPIVTDLLSPAGLTDALAPADAARFARERHVDILVTNAPQALKAAV